MIYGRVPGIGKPVARIVRGTAVVRPDAAREGSQAGR